MEKPRNFKGEPMLGVQEVVFVGCNCASVFMEINGAFLNFHSYSIGCGPALHHCYYVNVHSLEPILMASTLVVYGS